MEWLFVGLVVMYIWAGMSVCCVAGEDMHSKEKVIMYPMIMLTWWLTPILCLARGNNELD